MNKPKTTFANIDAYIATFPEDIRAKLQELRAFIKKVVPEATETISYQMPTFDLNKKHLVYFAAFKNHLGFYPFPSGIAAFAEETKDYVTSKGTIQFPYNEPMPWKLIERILKFRVDENLQKKVN